MRVARHARREAARLIYGRGHRQAKAHLRFMRVRLGRLIRDMERKTADRSELQAAIAPVLEKAALIHAQKPGDRHKLYALHAPEVECIGKGKACTRYEFGVKASLPPQTSVAKADSVGAMTCPSNPYDDHTLGRQIAQVERVIRHKVERAYMDRGYRGHGIEHDDAPDIVISHTKGITSPTIRRQFRRRNAIEPVIGHMKHDGLLERNHLKGERGDTANVMLCAIGRNLRLLLAWFRALLSAVLVMLLCLTKQPRHCQA